MCGGTMGSLLRGGFKKLGVNLRDHGKPTDAESTDSVETKEANASQAVRKKKRASDVLANNSSDKKTTLGG